MSTHAKAGARTERVSRRAERRIQERRAAHQRRLLFFGGAIAVAIVAVVALILASTGDSDADDGFPPVVAGATIDPSILQDGRVLGDPNAPATVVEWFDYQCPACAMVTEQVQPQLIAEYVATGKVKFEARDFAFLDRKLSIGADGKIRSKGVGESVRAAEAAACAADQGKYWAFHDTVFANHRGENEGAYSAARLAEMARLSGLDMTVYNQCVEDRTHRAEIEQMYLERNELGINSTPTFVVNGKLVLIGGYNDLKNAIDAALAA
jgi:protein-disulfide isomerase